MWHTNILNHRVSVCMVAKPFHKTWGTYSGKQSLQLWRFSVLGKKKGTGGRGGLLKNSFLQDILWSFSAWLTEGLISSWVCNCGSFCSMSAIADLINKVLWQCTVYFQGLDLRAESSGVGYSLPHIHSRRHTMIRLVLFYTFLFATKSHENISTTKLIFCLSIHPDYPQPVFGSQPRVHVILWKIYL